MLLLCRLPISCLGQHSRTMCSLSSSSASLQLATLGLPLHPLQSRYVLDWSQPALTHLLQVIYHLNV